MTREQIIANAKLGAEQSAADGFAVTPRNPKHLSRILELKKKRKQQDEKHNDTQDDLKTPATVRA